MTDYYPNRPGYYQHAPETSRAAAASVSALASSIRARVLATVADAAQHGATGDEIAEKLDLLVYQVRSRLSELRFAGSIVDSTRRRQGASGRMGAVWVLPMYGPPPPPDAQGNLDLSLSV